MLALEKQSLSKARIWPKSMSEQQEKKQGCYQKAPHMGKTLVLKRNTENCLTNELREISFRKKGSF